MAVVTRGYHPLPFEHLEPKRFEDLVRQLAYDFRAWRQLEPTGRAGADDSFDIRGMEVVYRPAGDEEVDDEPSARMVPDRQWLFQCKREKAIGPTKLVGYLDDIPAGSRGGLYGLVIAAPCNFSKTAFDEFRSWSAKNGIQECHLWGRASLEDMLFQPKNDHLLFAYFGISLQLRRQKTGTAIRRIVSLKRKLTKILEEKHFPGTRVVLRDFGDERYPYAGEDDLSASSCRWRMAHTVGIGHDGLKLVTRHHLAWYDYETEQWDFASRFNNVTMHERDDPWMVALDEEGDAAKKSLWDFWRSFLPGCQLHILFVATVPFDRIVEVDDIGDDVTDVSTIFTEFDAHGPIHSERCDIFFHSSRSSINNVEFHSHGHVRVFPDEFRSLEWEKSWFERNGFKYSSGPLIVPKRQNDQNS